MPVVRMVDGCGNSRYRMIPAEAYRRGEVVIEADPSWPRLSVPWPDATGTLVTVPLGARTERFYATGVKDQNNMPVWCMKIRGELGFEGQLRPIDRPELAADDYAYLYALRDITIEIRNRKDDVSPEWHE